MIVLSNTTEQTLQPGQSITFNTVVQHTGCGESFRNNSGAVGLNAPCAVYEVAFNANVGGTTAAVPVELSIAIGGSPLTETAVISTPAAVGDLNNVSASTYLKTERGLSNSISVQNTGANPIVISPDGLALSIIRKG